MRPRHSRSNACTATLITDETSARDGHEPKVVAMTLLDLTRPMAPLTFTNPFAPVGYTPGGQPVYPAQGARGGSRVEFAVGDDDGDDPEFDDDQGDADDDDDDEEQLPANMRGKPRRPAARRADDDDDEPDDDEDDPDADWQPPTRDAWERVQGALKRANGEAGKRRRIGKSMDKLGIDDLDTWLTARGIDPSTGQPFGDDVVGTEDDESDGLGPDGDYEREPAPRPAADERKRDRETARQVLAAEQRGRRAERDNMMPILAEQTARIALRDAGFSGTKSQLERALRSIDHESIELDMSDGAFDLIGMDEEIEKLREDFPEFFETRATRRTRETRPNNARTATAARPRSSARDVDGGERGRQPKKALGWAEQMVEQMNRRGR